MKLSILIIGKGGREHALTGKLAQSSTVSRMLFLPGNGYTAQLDEIDNIAHVGGIPCFASGKEAAELEDSKVFAEEFKQKHNIPTARFRKFDDHAAARTYLISKADGVEALRDTMVNEKFGSAGSSVVIEEFLEGNSLPPEQDHKRILEENSWPYYELAFANIQYPSGGMGVYAPMTEPVDIMLACVAGTLRGSEVKMESGYACNLVVKAGGYPEVYEQGQTIMLGSYVHFLHAGTECYQGKVETAEGRLLSVAAARKS
ncbi:putative bifunctional purine Ade1 [Xylariaceae sp. FL0016]|nr:putative bifunctional purine Ade1 [Xylariaceae sp. FL0016]